MSIKSASGASISSIRSSTSGIKSIGGGVQQYNSRLLVIGGGGNTGGPSRAGGGGAGGVVALDVLTLTKGATYTTTIGPGGGNFSSIGGTVFALG